MSDSQAVSNTQEVGMPCVTGYLRYRLLVFASFSLVITCFPTLGGKKD
jgi:hypothetical protein